MEILFKKYFWLFHLLFLALSAYLIATFVNAFIGQKLTSLAAPSAAVATKAEAPRSRTRNFHVANEANIFGALREDLVGQQAECEEDKDCQGGTCEDGVCKVKDDGGNATFADAVPSELRGKLIGVAVFDEPTLSVATIIDSNAGRNAIASLYSINNCAPLPDAPAPDEDDDDEDAAEPINLPRQLPCKDLMEVATVKSIEFNRVYFYNSDTSRMEYFTLGEEPKGKAPRISKRKKKKKKKDDTGKGIHKKSDTNYEIEQSEVDKALGNLSSLATQARIVPAFEKGKPIGFKLFSIRPNSLYSKIGIKNGDVVKRINGYEINAPDKALEIYQKLKDSKGITVDLKRRGKPVTLEYNIVP